jgi:hypothetical protein
MWAASRRWEISGSAFTIKLRRAFARYGGECLAEFPRIRGPERAWYNGREGRGVFKLRSREWERGEGRGESGSQKSGLEDELDEFWI